MSGVLRRVRAHAGTYGVLAVIALSVPLLVTAAPRIATRIADRGLRQQIGAGPATARDITYRYAPDPHASVQAEPDELAGVLGRILDTMPPAVRQVIGEKWYDAETPATLSAGPDLRPGPPLDLVLRAAGGTRDAVNLVAGRWPATSAGHDAGSPAVPVEITLAEPVAAALGLHVGSDLAMASPAVDAAPARATVVGLFRAKNATAGVWDPRPSALIVTPPPDTGGTAPVTAVALTSDAAVVSRVGMHWPVRYAWRYRVDPDRLTAAHTAAVRAGLRRLDRSLDLPVAVSEGVDRPLGAFADERDSALTILYFVLAGVLAALAGLYVLVVAVLMRGRAGEIYLLSARGAGRWTLARRAGTETTLVVLPAAVLGAVLGLTVPGQSLDLWPAAAATLLIAAGVPLATAAARQASARPARRRRRLARGAAAEVAVLLFAVAGGWLLHSRGLAATGQVDTVLVFVPALIAVAAALPVLHAYPALVRGFARLSARGRGMVVFVGTALARSMTRTAFIVVVVAVAGATFCGVLANGIRAGRDAAARVTVPADAVVGGGLFAPDTAGVLAAMPGITGVAPLVAESDQDIAEPGGRSVPRTYVLVVDVPTFARVLRQSGAGTALPESLRQPARPGAAVSAVLSRSVADDLPHGGTVTAQGHQYAITVGAVVRSFPAIPAASARFVVLPAQSLPGDPLTPTGFLLSARHIDRAAVQRAADQGQRRYFGAGAVVGRVPDTVPAVTTRATFTAELARSGANGLLSLGFVTGVAGGTVLVLAAILLAAMAGAATRRRTLAGLRAMGVSKPQRYGTLMVELFPRMTVAVLVGAGVGVALPWLFGSVLRASAFTGGAAVLGRLGWTGVAAVAIVAVCAPAVAAAVEIVVGGRPGRDQVSAFGEDG